MTSVDGGSVEAPVVLLLQRSVGAVLRAPLGMVKAMVCLMAGQGVPNDGDGGFPSSSSGDAPATRTSFLVHLFQIEEDRRVRNFVGELLDKVTESGVAGEGEANLRRSTMAAASDRFELEKRAAWRRKIGDFWGRWSAGLLAIYSLKLVAKR